MRGSKKMCSANSVEKKVDSKVENYFLSDGEESKAGDSSGNSSWEPKKTKLMEFCPDKPYRLALYVHPSTRRRVNLSDSKILANLTQMRQNQDKENNKKPKRGKTKTEKENIVKLFEENDGVEAQKKSRKLDDKIPADGERPDKIAKKGILSFLNINETVSKKPENIEENSSPTKTKEKRACRSYVKKSKENMELKELDEPTLEEEVNDKETKKHTKLKAKKQDMKNGAEEEEYEKWAQSINSGFEEIDKFELSITYD